MSATYCRAWNTVEKVVDYVNKLHKAKEHFVFKDAFSPTVIWQICPSEKGDIIVCNIIESSMNGLGYSAYCEAEFPFYFSCPPEYLDKTAERCPEWRRIVMKNVITPGTGNKELAKYLKDKGSNVIVWSAD
jgi:hypothetical protein